MLLGPLNTTVLLKKCINSIEIKGGRGGLNTEKEETQENVLHNSCYKFTFLKIFEYLSLVRDLVIKINHI